MSDEQKLPNLATTPPPAGEEDLYSAATVVGPASAELLALVRAAEEGTLDAKAPATTAPSAPAAAKQAAPPAPLPKPASEPPKAAPKAASEPPPAPPARAVAPTLESAADVTTKRRAIVTAEDERRPTPGLPPSVAILLIFVAATVALAALVR
jgi:hypothetical protein